MNALWLSERRTSKPEKDREHAAFEQIIQQNYNCGFVNELSRKDYARSVASAGIWIDPSFVPEPEHPRSAHSVLQIIDREKLEKWAEGGHGTVRKKLLEKTLKEGLPPIPGSFPAAPYRRMFDFEGLPDPENPDEFWSEREPDYSQAGPPWSIILKNARPAHVQSIWKTSVPSIVFWQMNMKPEDLVMPSISEHADFVRVVFYQCDTLKEISSAFINKILDMRRRPDEQMTRKCVEVWVLGCPVSSLPTEILDHPFGSNGGNDFLGAVRVHWHFRGTALPPGWFDSRWKDLMADSLRKQDSGSFSLVVSPTIAGRKNTEGASYASEYSPPSHAYAASPERLVSTDVPAFRESQTPDRYFPSVFRQKGPVRLWLVAPSVFGKDRESGYLCILDGNEKEFLKSSSALFW